MSWSLTDHIKGHSFLTHDGLPDNFNLEHKNNIHFTTSFDKSQFILNHNTTELNHNTTDQKQIDKIMTDFFEDLKSTPYYFEESKGAGKRRTKLLDLENTLMAYHNSASEAMNTYSVHDHIHLLIPANLKNSQGTSTHTGKGYIHLRRHISEVAARHNLVPNFEESTQYETDKNKKAQATSFTWYLKKASDTSFINAVKDGKLLKALNRFESHYKGGNTTQDHLYKGYIDLQYRLNKLDMDFMDKEGKNLRYDFPILINQHQKKEIEILKSGDKDKIAELMKGRDNKITRACVEQTLDGFNSVVYDVLQNKGQLLEGIDLTLIKEIASDPSIKVDIEKKDLNQKKKNWEKSLGYHVKQDIETVLKYSTNEKTFRENLQELHYKDVKFKHKDKQKIGVSFTNPHNDKVATIYLNQLNMSMPQITKQLMDNKQLLDQGQLPQKPQLKYKDSFLSKYIPKDKDPEYVNKKKKFQDIQFERIYGRTPEADLSGYYIAEDKILKKGTFIDVQDNKITVKHQKQSELNNNVKVILDTAIAKGWNLSKLNIKGSTAFKLAVQAEIQRRQENKLVKVKELTEATPVDIKVKDVDILKQLKSMNLHNYSIQDKEKEYGQVFDIIERSVKNKNLELLNECYDVLPHQGQEELRLKIINYAKVLDIKTQDINIEIGKELGLNEDEIKAFKDEIKLSDNYDEKFLDIFIEKIEARLNDYYLVKQTLDDKELEIKLNLLQRLNKEFNQYKSNYISRKEYIDKIEKIDQHLESGCFYSASKIINSLDNEDKIIQNVKYQNSIHISQELQDFDKLKERINEQSKLDEAAYFAERNQNDTDSTFNEDVQKQAKELLNIELQNNKHNRKSYHKQQR